MSRAEEARILARSTAAPSPGAPPPRRNPLVAVRDILKAHDRRLGALESITARATREITAHRIDDAGRLIVTVDGREEIVGMIRNVNDAE